MGSRQHTQREWKLLSWWLATFHPTAEIWMQLRVGPTLPIGGVPPRDRFDENASRLRNRWADAVFVENAELHLVEAKVEPDPGIFSQLIHYARKVRMDPQFAPWAASRLHLIALVQRDDPSVAFEAPFYGIEWEVFQPSYLSVEETHSRGGDAGNLFPPLPEDFAGRVSLLRGGA